METLDVDLGERSYPIFIGPELLKSAEVMAGAVPGRDVLVVSNDKVAPLYLQTVKSSLPGKRIAELILPDGEEHKTWESARRILDALADGGFHRDVVVIALGGGVVGDMAGFAAACYQRGVSYVQLPTTLLAQVDSSVGGKTAVNHPKAKNLIGAFHQPARVIADTSTLRTLDRREYRAGLAEVIKYGIIRDAAFFSHLAENMEALQQLQELMLIRTIRRCCEIKAEIVADDEREQGVRALLNLGHTFGHAIEAAVGFGKWLHGEAVAAGMVLAARLSVHAGWLEKSDYERIVTLIAAAGLPTEPPPVDGARLLQTMRMDKKILGDALRLVLPTGIGEAVVTADYPPGLLHKVLGVEGAAR